MAQTVANLADVMKEVFTSDRLEKQFFDQQDTLAELQRTSKFTIGKKAVVPIHKGRSGGYSVKSSAGGALNSADEQKVDRAEYTVPYNYHQIEIEIAALNEAHGGAFSVGTALGLEVEGAIADIRNQVERQFVSNGDSLVAGCLAGAANTTILLDPAEYGSDAISRGWLYEGLQIDIGTTANEVAVGDGVTITAVTESDTAPTLTVDSSVTETANDYVSIKDARSGTTSNESSGLRTMFGSTTSAVGGLDPDNAGESFWKPAHVDTTTTVLSLDLLLTMQRKVQQKGGKPQTRVLSSLKQQASFYSLLQSQVRFQGEMKVGAGAVNRTVWNGLEWEAMNAIPDQEVYFLTPEDLAVVTGARFKQPTWVSSLQGANQGLIWKQGNTSFVDAIAYPVALALKRRNRAAAAIGLTA